MVTDTINIYVIQSEHLKLRLKLLEQTLENIRIIMINNNYKVNIIVITTPTQNDINEKIQEYNNQINLNPDEIDDEEFKNNQMKFNIAQLSNLYKHKKAYETIKNSNVKHNYIVEDDIILLPNYIDNFRSLIKKLETYEYDLLFTCLSSNTDDNNDIDILLSSVYFKILLTKNSYFITPETANKLYEYLNIIRFPIKLSISKFIYDNKNTLKSYILNKHTILEGSKLGIYTTSINSNNYLIQNNGFIHLIEILNKIDNNDVEIDIKQVQKHYEDTGKDNPDFQHILGLIYYKKKMYKEAIENLKEAVKSFKNKEGYMIQYNEILNNCINIHQYYQDDITECFKLKGKY